MTALKNKRVIVGCIPSENNEPVLLLRGNDPAATDVILAYLKKILEGDCPEEHIHEVLNTFFLFKEWQAELHSPAATFERKDAKLVESAKVGLVRDGGYCRRSELMRKHGVTQAQVDRILPKLGVDEFRIAIRGRPAIFYVLHEAAEKFRQYACQEEWTILTSGHFDKKTTELS